jgi:hypothetical protein
MRAALLFGLAPLLACSQVSSNRWPPEGSARITVIGLEPAPNSTVDSDTVMEVTIEYSLPSDYPGKYIVAPQFATTPGGPTVSGQIEGGRPPALDSTKGTFRFRHPLRSLVEDPTVEKPLRFWFYLNVETGGNASAVVAKTGPYRYGVR